MNVQPSNPNTEVLLGHLFGWPIRQDCRYLFDNVQCPITDKASTSGNDLSHFRYGQFSGSTFEHPANSVLFMGRTLAERIANYLGKCALRARTIEDKECYELASTIVLRAERAEGTIDIYRSCFAWKYGSTPEILAEKLAYTREWMLRGSVESTNLIGVPKKPVQSVKSLSEEKRGRA